MTEFGKHFKSKIKSFTIEYTKVRITRLSGFVSNKNQNQVHIYKFQQNSTENLIHISTRVKKNAAEK